MTVPDDTPAPVAQPLSADISGALGALANMQDFIDHGKRTLDATEVENLKALLGLDVSLLGKVVGDAARSVPDNAAPVTYASGIGEPDTAEHDRRNFAWVPDNAALRDALRVWAEHRIDNYDEDDGREIDRMLAAAPVSPAGLDVERAALDRDTLYRRIHALPGLVHHGKGEQCFPITDAVLAALASPEEASLTRDEENAWDVAVPREASR